ncbi:unnamed protein product [Protopolystoma xenopodis]|uniref:Uncharacterized protein n=1 Tax=Protopolystoma xenopodis TaxID=117903 RepID=A0A448X7C4_9PLAT|nr:unnamed protein product [Protopolystoma xenopodis]
MASLILPLHIHPTLHTHKCTHDADFSSRILVLFQPHLLASRRFGSDQQNLAGASCWYLGCPQRVAGLFHEGCHGPSETVRLTTLRSQIRARDSAARLCLLSTTGLQAAWRQGVRPLVAWPVLCALVGIGYLCWTAKTGFHPGQPGGVRTTRLHSVLSRVPWRQGWQHLHLP